MAYKEKIDVVILVNGPGELSSYVRPTVAELVKLSDDFVITLVFTPCPYSTGKEIGIARGIPGVANVIPANNFIKWALLKVRPKGIVFGIKGIVVFMGGDLLYGKIIAKRLKYPAIAYSEAYAKWPEIYKRILVPDASIYEKFKNQGFPEDQIKIVGNLMVDSIKVKRSKGEFLKLNRFEMNKKLVAFLPGSRDFQIKYTLPFYFGIIKLLSQRRSDLQFAYIISPYLPMDKFLRRLENSGSDIVDGRIVIDGIPVKIIVDDQFDAMAASELIVTIPGTNTAEVAVIGTPMISVFPMDSFSMIPLEGVWDLVGRIPVLGYYFKRKYVKIMLEKTRFFAIPNIKTGRSIVPELTGNIQAIDVADKIDKLLNTPDILKEMSEQLREALGGPGAAKKIAQEIMNEALLQTS
jgi:lipid-A-disaccharide synthase